MTSLFGQSAAGNNASGSGLFGQNFGNQQNQTGGQSLFGNNIQPSNNLFGSSALNNAAQPQSKGLFGQSMNAQPNQGGGLFGNQPAMQGGGLFGNTAASQSQNSPFGANTNKPTGGLFGASANTNQQQSGSGLFESLGASTQTQAQPQQQQPGGGSSLFGNLGQVAQPSLGGSVQQSNALAQSQNQSRLFQGSDFAPRQKSVIDQIELAFAKWNPQSAHTLFQTYLYNAVPPEDAPFYGPGPQDDESQWEEALAKKPSVGSIPVSVRGFEQLAMRMQQQYQNLSILRGRLHEINSGLTNLSQKHDLEISIRVAECKRRHMRISRQCLRLAARTMVLRNRGYAMDGAEEELRRRLLTLEKSVMDPAMSGQSEEIWARMVIIRDGVRQLEREYEKAGKSFDARSHGTVEAGTIAKVQKILEDYQSQLSHLQAELGQITNDWTSWQAPGGSQSNALKC